MVAEVECLVAIAKEYRIELGMYWLEFREWEDDVIQDEVLGVGVAASPQTEEVEEEEEEEVEEGLQLYNEFFFHLTLLLEESNTIYKSKSF